MMAEPYVSITGLKLRNPIYLPLFWWHAARSMSEARRTDGNICALATTRAGVHYTLSHWQDFAAMRKYLRQPRHLEATRVFPRIATGRTLGFKSDQLPDWNTAISRLNSEGREFT